MPLPRPPAEVAHVAFSGRYGTTTWANVMWLFCAGGDSATGSDVGSLAGAMYNAYSLHLHVLAPTAVHLEQCKVVLFQTVGELQAIEATDTAGSHTGSDLTAQVAKVITWQIDDYYRGGHPRTYLPAGVYEQLDGVNEWDGTTIAAVASGADAFLTAVNGITTTNISSVSLGTLSRYSGGVPRTPPIFRPFTGSTAQARVCTQRRRLGREL
jgi:hypothetical protein